jgi:hypothetical protein
MTTGGGSSALSISRLSPSPSILPTPLGCFSGVTRLPVVLADALTFGTMTPERCARLAWVRGFSFAGTVNGVECRAGELSHY